MAKSPPWFLALLLKSLRVLMLGAGIELPAVQGSGVRDFLCTHTFCLDPTKTYEMLIS